MLAADNIAKSFGGVRVLHGIDLAAAPGELRAMLGENGTGKSTLMKILAGHEQPDEGRILLRGVAMRFSGAADAERQGVVLVPQEQLLAG